MRFMHWKPNEYNHLRRIRMFRKLSFTSFTLFVVIVVTTGVCFAYTLLTKEKALKKVFGSRAQVETETVELSGDTLMKA